MARSVFAGGRVHIDWHESQIRVLLSGPSGEVSEDVQRRARAVQRRAQTLAPFRTGELRSSIHVNTRYPSDGAVADITADAPHSLMVEFGRKHQYPTNKKFLHWIGEGGDPVFVLSAGPIDEVPFMRNALDEAGD